MEAVGGNLSEITTYMQETLKPFSKAPNPLFANIKDFYLVGKKWLVTIREYCPQGSLKDYGSQQEFSDEMVREVEKCLKSTLSKWNGQYRFIDNEQILIKKGKPIIKPPPFPTPSVKQKIKESQDGSCFYAP